MDARTSIGHHLRWARKRANMTQEQLAAAARVPQSTVARIERGNALPRTATLIALLHATGHELSVERRLGADLDPERIRFLLRLDPPERVRIGLAAAMDGQRRGRRRTDPIRIVRRLRRFGVRFVLVGEMAEAARGSTVPVPAVVRVCHAQDPESLDRLETALADLDVSPRPDRSALEGSDPVTVTCAAGTLRLDARPSDPPDDYEVLSRTADRMLVADGLLASVASLEDLVRMRRGRATPEDRDALELLAVVRAELPTGGWGALA
jgi:transcriptional regulator with XRE-family HTH domain